MEEQVSHEDSLSDEINVIRKYLYLTLQLLELGKPVVLTLYIIGAVQNRGRKINLHRLPEIVIDPVIPVSSSKKNWIEYSYPCGSSPQRYISV